MTKTNQQTQKIFQDFHQTMNDEQAKLKKGLNHLVRKSAIEAEKLMKIREKEELKKIEEDLAKTETPKEEKPKSRGIFSFFRKS